MEGRTFGGRGVEVGGREGWVVVVMGMSSILYPDDFWEYILV